MDGSFSSRFAGLQRMPVPLVAAQVGAIALVAFAAEESVVDAYELPNAGIALVIGATAVIVTGWLLAARTARRAADAFDGGPSLPAATLVSR